MIWWVILIKFIFAVIAIFFTCAFVLSCISSIVNPRMNVVENGEVEEMGDRSRSIMAIIMSIAWGIVIAL